MKETKTGWSLGGFTPGVPAYVRVYNHGDHRSLTPKRYCDQSGYCDRILTRDEIVRWAMGGSRDNERGGFKCWP